MQASIARTSTARTWGVSSTRLRCELDMTHFPISELSARCRAPVVIHEGEACISNASQLPVHEGEGHVADRLSPCRVVGTGEAGHRAVTVVDADTSAPPGGLIVDAVVRAL